ncbi:MAG: polysaccharide biosynthesis/export family protein [Gammaproteobacteria bacterium]|nr:polysaccharide biosynthesis/export family protein [Gammaproteobacteria bacterium]
MTRINNIYLILKSFLFCFVVFLSGCAIIPGMHMNTQSVTPTPDAEGDVVRPSIVPITADLILRMQREALIQQQVEAKRYVPPAGFYTDPSQYSYKVGIGDVLTVALFAPPDLEDVAVPGQTSAQSAAGSSSSSNNGAGYSSTFTVNGQGYIYYPYVGYVRVKDKTPDEIRQDLTVSLARYIKDPQVSVQMNAYRSHQISVVGEVQNPVTLNLDDTPMTILSAVGKAGLVPCAAVNVCSDLDDVTLTQNGKTVRVNLKTMKAPDGSSTNWILQSGAIIQVPNNALYQVYALGGVNMPGAYRMVDDSMDLRELIGRASGVAALSDPGYVYVVRDYGGNPKIYLLNLRSPDAFNLAAEFALKPQDVVFVSISKLQTFNNVLSQILPSLTTYALVESIKK